MASEFLKMVGERIRSLRREKGLTQEALSEKANIHYSYISGIEHADRNILMETLEKIITALDIVPLEVFQFHELDFVDIQADKKTALEAINSLLVERNAGEILNGTSSIQGDFCSNRRSQEQIVLIKSPLWAIFYFTHIFSFVHFRSIEKR